jgi:hypothetical protein
LIDGEVNAEFLCEVENERIPENSICVKKIELTTASELFVCSLQLMALREMDSLQIIFGNSRITLLVDRKD